MFPLWNWIEQFCPLVANTRNVPPRKNISVAGIQHFLSSVRILSIDSICISIYVAAYLQRISSPAIQILNRLPIEFPVILMLNCMGIPKKKWWFPLSKELIPGAPLCYNIMIPSCYNLTPAFCQLFPKTYNVAPISLLSLVQNVNYRL